MGDPSDPFKPCWHCGSAEHVTSDHPQDKKSLLPKTAKELIEKCDTLDNNTFLWAIRRLPEHEKDLLVACPNHVCNAREGEPCRGFRRREIRAGVTAHIQRRVKRLLKGIR